jgi:type I restriction enzyme S subunit
MSDDATLNEFIDNSGDSTESGSATEDYQDTGDLQTLETSPIEDWKLVRLDDILSFEYGDNLPANTRQEGSIPVYGSNGQVDTHTEANVDSEGIIIGRKGSIGKGEFSDKPFWAIDTTYYISDEETDENLRFIYYLLQDMELERLNAASAIPGLNRNDAYNLNTFVPPLSEQRKIATVLHTVDQAIQKTEEIIGQKKKLRLGLSQSLFSDGIQSHSRFKSSKYGKIPDSWEVSRLGEVTSQMQAGGTPDTDVEEYYGGSIPWVKTGELSQHRVTETEQNITERGLEESTARLLPAKTVLIAMYGATTGEVSILGIEASTNQACCGIIPADELLPEFLYHQLDHLSDHLESLSAGSGQQNISKGIINKFDILLPAVDEQESIVNILNNVDESIKKNKSTKEQYQRLKQALMQDLLSGEVRTTNTNIEIPEEVAKYG